MRMRSFLFRESYLRYPFKIPICTGMTSEAKNQDQTKPQRKYPRRAFNRKVGLLCHGVYFLGAAKELGEGGLSFVSDFVLSDGNELVVSFQIPEGSFVFLRAVVTGTQKNKGDKNITHGLKFTNIDFSHKRQIRAFVSAQN